MKRLKKIQDKNEEQLQIIKNKDSNDLSIKSVTNILEAKNMITKFKSQEKRNECKRLSFKKDQSLEFDFKKYICL